MISWRRVGEVVRRIQQRAIPQFIEISVKLIRARLGDVVDLGCSIAPLIHGIGKSVDGHFRNRIQSQDEVGGKATVEIGERVVGFQPVNDVAVGEGGQAIKFHVAIPVGAADEIVAAARSVDEGSGRKLQRVGQIPAGIRQILQRRRIQSGGCIGVFRIDEWGFAVDLNYFIGSSNLKREIHGLLLAQTRNDIVILLRFEAGSFRFDRVGAGL